MNLVIRKAYNQCKPEEWLKYGDPRYVPLTEEGLRGTTRDPIKTMQDTITMSEGETCQLFSGFRGCGKTTELQRLAHDLKEAGYWVILIDTEEYINLKVPATLSDLWITIAGGFDNFLEKLDPNAHDRKRFWEKLDAFLGSPVSLSDFKIGIPKVAEVKIALKENLDYRTKLNQELAKKKPQFLAECRAFLDGAISFLAEKNSNAAGTVVILDSFEKLEGDFRNADEVRASAEAIFNREWQQLKTPCHSIFTVPTWLTFTDSGADCDMGRTHLLPMCKISERNGDRFDKGVEAMLVLLRKRMDVDKIFGDPKRIEPLIEKSGGYPRDLLRMVREVLLLSSRETKLPIQPESLQKHIDQVLRTYRELYEQSLDGHDLPLLAKVARNHSVVGWTRDEKFRLAQLFDNHFVMSYQNGERWLDLHPLLRETESVRKELLKPEKPESKST